MRKKIVAGNWKMNLLQDEVIDYILELDKLFHEVPKDIKLVIFPSTIYLDYFINLPENIIYSGAQNCSIHQSGAYTGEVSAKMLRSLSGEKGGLKYCLVGHSERRQYFGETNEILQKKVDALLQENLNPIYCCGETKAERESKVHFNIVESQIRESLYHLSKEEFENVIIAYEPVWAIGTGLTATSSEAQEMHAFIRNSIKEKYGNDVAQKKSILYGGSCNAANAKELFSQPDIDGGLIGGASLKVESFLQIANSF